ncbi:hypothetical protein [Psychroflexus salis]|uniref:Uncharacterized protein n=1 Tax=Psychroflexus salis TaxID=1526574 RepID=A0A917EA03_9FLAO|nr:hypothetical protein [Psychroflexus salis]GGE15337.1 hypothetical protein GCM10010831_15850 [Psychroflexus salis]
MKSKLKKCFYSGEPFLPKRSTQKFASVKNRNDYHNERNRKFKMPVTKVNKILFENFKIIDMVLGDEQEKQVDIQFLKGINFQFQYFTHTASKAEKRFYCIYNFGLMKVDEKSVKLFKL